MKEELKQEIKELAKVIAKEFRNIEEIRINNNPNEEKASMAEVLFFGDIDDICVSSYNPSYFHEYIVPCEEYSGIFGSFSGKHKSTKYTLKHMKQKDFPSLYQDVVDAIGVRLLDDCSTVRTERIPAKDTLSLHTQ